MFKLSADRFFRVARLSDERLTDELSIDLTPLLSLAIFAVPAVLKASAFSLDCPGSAWPEIRWPLIAGLSILVLLFAQNRAAVFAIHLTFFCAFSSCALRCLLPYADRYLQYTLLKPMEVIGTLGERPLYSLYRLLPENALPRDIYGLDYRYWDFTYLPGALIPAFASHLFDLDPRIPFLIIQVLVAGALFTLNRGLFAQAVSSLLLVSPLVELIIPTVYLHNLILFPTSVLLIVAAYRLREHSVLSAFILAPAFMMLQSTWLLLPFVAAAFVRRGALKPICGAVVLAAASTGLAAAQSPEAFYRSAIAVHFLTDLEYFASTAETSYFSFAGVLIRLGIPANYIVNNPIRGVLAVAAYLGILVVSLRRDGGLMRALHYAAFAGIFFIFFSKLLWGCIAYLLGFAFILLFRDPSNTVESVLRLSMRTARFTSVATAALLFVSAFILVGAGRRAYYFPVGEERTFAVSAEGDVQPASAKNHRSVPLTIHHQFGWANSQFGRQYWILTPPGRYQLQICDELHCELENLRISMERSFGLRVPLGINSREGKTSVRYNGLHRLAIIKGGIEVEQARSFALKRLE